MKNRIIIASLAAVSAIVISLTACEKDPVPAMEYNVFIEQIEMGTYDASSSIFKYEMEDWQMYYSPSRYSTRIHKDDMSEYLGVTLKQSPAVDIKNKMKGTLFTKGITGMKYSASIEVLVLKIENGKLWLWNSADKMGYILPWEDSLN